MQPIVLRGWALAKIVTLGGVLIWPFWAFTDSAIVLSEVMANPTDEDHEEFIEIFNPGTSAVDVGSWTFTDGDALDTVIAWDPVVYGALSDTDWITGTTLLGAGKFAVILDSEYAAGAQSWNVPQGTLALTVQNSTLGNALTTTDPITLFDATGVVVSTYGTPKNLPDWKDRDDDGLDGIPFDPGNGFSVERVDVFAADTVTNWIMSPDASGQTTGRGYTPPSPETEPEDDPEDEGPEDPQDPDQPENNPPDVPDPSNPPAPDDDDEDDSPSERAQDSNDLVVNELLPNPSGSDDAEFIELWNRGATTVNVVDWVIGDARTSFVLEKTDIAPNSFLLLSRSQTKIALNNSGGETVTLKNPWGVVKGTVTYDRSQEGESYQRNGEAWEWSKQPTPGKTNVFFSNTPPQAVIHVSKTTIRLGEVVELDASASTDADSQDLEFEWRLGEEKISGDAVWEWEPLDSGEATVVLRVTDESGATDEENVTIVIQAGDLSKDLSFSEIVPNPKGSDDGEWIEIRNVGKSAVDLRGWTISNTRQYGTIEESVIVPAEGFAVVDHDMINITLHNTGDRLFLIDPANVILQGVEVGPAKEGQSFARKGVTSQWAWTSDLTPAAENRFPEKLDVKKQSVSQPTQIEELEPEEKEEHVSSEKTSAAAKIVSATVWKSVTFDQLQNLSKGETVEVSGTVVAPPGDRGLQKMFISDGALEVEIYSYYKTFPEVSTGDTVQVHGRVSEAGGKKRVNISSANDMTILSKNVEKISEELVAADPLPASTIPSSNDLSILGSSDTTIAKNFLPWNPWIGLAAGAVVLGGTVANIVAWRKIHQSASQNWVMECEDENNEH